MVRGKPRRRPEPRGPPRNDNRSYRPPPPPRYQQKDTDSWRPGGGGGGGGGDRRSFYDDYRPSDSYRPQVPRGDFTFRFDKPAGISNLPPRDFRGGNDRRRDGGRGGRRPGRPRWQPPPHLSERALISGATENLPEERVGDLDASAKFRPIDELSDDDQLDMDISSSSEKSDTEGPSKKRARTVAETEVDDSVPKWSNPDPYTALPCPDESQRKKKDVVKLIRKARLEEESKPSASTKAEDFISFDLSDDDGEESDSLDEAPPPPPKEPPPPPPPPPPPTAPPTAPAGPRSSIGSLPPRPDQSGPLGSRKRTADDEIKPPDYGQLKKAASKPAKGLLLPAWLPKANEASCPWAEFDHSATTDMGFRLHKEVMDFYEYVRPRDFEQRIRNDLVENLKKAMARDARSFSNAQVHPFGSFMSGLYLPTADMDLVVCSASFMRGGPPTYLSAKSWLYKFRKFLQDQRVAESDSIQVIAHARIPLVKYVDKMTGLKVDVSFENLGGVGAIDTFLRWKQQYPAMPILVTVIKHFLLMRGLNEPVNGGIGGFSVICLVVSMLQLMPQVQSGNLVPEHNLGEMLLEFFDLYGRQFRHEANAISLTRPVGYIPKRDVSTFTYKSTDRLSIIDPNNPANDISGGSSNIGAILARFDEAYYILLERMDEVRDGDAKGGILDVILEGDYSSFRKQRDYLRHVHEKHT